MHRFHMESFSFSEIHITVVIEIEKLVCGLVAWIRNFIIASLPLSVIYLQMFQINPIIQTSHWDWVLICKWETLEKLCRVLKVSCISIHHWYYRISECSKGLPRCYFWILTDKGFHHQQSSSTVQDNPTTSPKSSWRPWSCQKQIRYEVSGPQDCFEM